MNTQWKDAYKCKMLALDLDGTLIGSNKEVSKENQKWIKKARDQGVYILLISGRPYVSMKKVAETLKLDECLIVAMAGCDIREYPSGKILKSNCISKEQVTIMHQIAKKTNCYLQVFRLDGSYYFQTETKYSKMYEAYFYYSGQPVDLENIPYDDVCKGMFIMEPEDLKDTEMKILKELPKELRAEPIWANMIDAYMGHVDKGTAIVHVAKILGISKEEIIACGDEKVDLPMFGEVGLSVAMGNAVAEVKDAADDVTLCNDEDGVAEVIKKYIISS